MDWKNKKTGWWLPLLVLLPIIWAIQAFPTAGEWYAAHVYPWVAKGLSAVALRVSFSLGDCFIVGCVCTLVFYLIYAFCKRLSFWHTLFRVFVFLGYIYVWFYLAWGLNYFRKDFYTRTGIPCVTYNQDSFRAFLTDYVYELNAHYVPVHTPDTAFIEQEVKAGYTRLAAQFGILSPDTILRAKPMLLNDFMSGVGVLGYMGPFFSEFCLNKELLPFQYPTSYAHELAHRLSIAQEAEANLYAYLVCTRSSDPEIRFCGYFSLFTYVMNNAVVSLPDVEYRKLIASIRPEILDLHKEKRVFWEARYHPLFGKAQHAIYNIFLKGNNIETGTENYSEVVGLLMSYKSAFPKVEMKTELAVY